MPGPIVSVSLVTYDGADWLPGCLAALAAQDYEDVEIIVLDNASSDDSRALVEAWAAGEGRGRVRLTASPTNIGYAAGHNRNIQAANGAYVLLLNQDVELDAGFLSAAVEALTRRPGVAAVQGRLRQLDRPGERSHRLDSTGLSMARDRRAVSRSQGQVDGPEHAVAGPVWGADGPAPVYRRAALQAARLPRRGGGWEILDEDFFLYKEDVDLAWRLHLLGWSAWYEPAALAWHGRGTGGTGATTLLDIARTNRSIRREAKALSWRNQRLMQIKNEEPIEYLRDLPWILRRELLSLAFILAFDPRRLGAVWTLLRGAPGAMRKRRYLRRRIAAQRSARGGETSWRRRVYDQLPDALRGPVRRTWERRPLMRSEGVARSQAGVATLPPRAADEARGAVLFVDDQVPQHDLHAGALTAFHYLRILRGEGLRVVFRPDDGVRREPYATELEAMGVHLWLGDADPAAWLAAQTESFDWAILSRPLAARRALPAVRRHTSARVLYLDHDLHYLREQRRFEATGDSAARSESRRLREIEAELFAAADLVLTFSPDEVADIRALAPGADVRVVTPAFYLDGAAATNGSAVSVAEREEIVFVGAYDHLPNVDAAEWLVGEIMPLVWNERPLAHVTLIGGLVPDGIAALDGDRVTVAGRVGDLAPYWASARLSIAPLRFGSGVKGKIIASLEAGVPVVTTPIGNEGIGLVDGRDALIASDAPSLAAAALRVLGDDTLARDLAQAGRQVLRERFGEDRVREDLTAALTDA